MLITQNLAPFRMEWVNELSKYADITVYHINEYEKIVNSKYTNFTPNIDKCEDISINILRKVKLFNYKKILKEKVDVLIIDGYGFIAQVILIILLKLLKRKYILSVDGGFINKKENKLKRFFKKIIISSPSNYLSTSKFTDKYLEHYGADVNKIYRHYFSYVHKEDILKFPIKYIDKNIYKKKLGLENKVTIVSVGRYEHRKGFDILLNSIKNIKEDIQVLIIGGNENEEYSELLTGIEDKVHFINFCNKELLKEYYCASDIFVLPTRYDIWGLVIGEAMSYGLPIITTDKCLAGISMIKNEENGFIVPINNSNRIESALRELIVNENLRYNMGKNNINKIKKYSIENSSKIDIENFKKYIGEKYE
ncbi:glycosyltransferase family 4 protein [Clostridium carnis]